MQISFPTPNFNFELIKTSEVKMAIFFYKFQPLREYSQGHLVFPLRMAIKDLFF